VCTVPNDCYKVTTFPKCRQSKTDSNAEASAVFLFIPSRQQPVGRSVRPSRVLPFTAQLINAWYHLLHLPLALVAAAAAAAATAIGARNSRDLPWE